MNNPETQTTWGTQDTGQINVREEFEDTKGVIRIVYRRRTNNTMVKRKCTKGQTTIYKTYT
jgi:hypothetical protein